MSLTSSFSSVQVLKVVPTHPHISIHLLSDTQPTPPILSLSLPVLIYIYIYTHTALLFCTQASQKNHRILLQQQQKKANNQNSIHLLGFNIMSESDQNGGGGGFNRPRMVAKKVLAKAQHEGDGAVVRRAIGRSELKNLDPFLMLDEFSVSPPAGFPDHPHRGFETVTYMLQGAFTHQDFAGHMGTIHTGDVQWMTAGRGIVHSEMPAGDGVQKGLQLWINLSSQDKMIEPRYQELLSEDIKRAEKDGVEVRVIAGESMGVHSPVYTRTPTMYLDFTMKPRSQLHQNIPESWNAFVYIIEGEGLFGSINSSSVSSSAHHVLVLSPGGDGVSVWNKSSKALRFVLLAGQPLNEPVVQYGPFVMNSQAEIDQTIEDYHFSKNGFEMAKRWRSSQ